MADIQETYERRYPALCRARDRLREILESVVTTIEDKTLVRAEVRNVRIKELWSIQRKIESAGWNPDQGLSHCKDLVAGRAVCNNVEDVYRFAELLKEQLPSFQGEFAVQDHITEPNEGGYRALHVNFRLDVEENPFLWDFVPCEVQIRSRLQDAWAELSHDDIYKQSSLPEDLRARAKDLAEVLAAADRISSDIRSRVMRETASPEQRPNMSQVSDVGLAYTFREVFGRSPPDYAVRLALDLCDQLQIASLEGFPELLARAEFRDKVFDVYRSIFGGGIGIEEIFLAALYAVAKGDNKAIRWVRKKARREWDELEQFAMNEALNSLPDSAEDLIKAIGDPRVEADIEGWAEALGATTDCAVCSTTVIQTSSFAEAAVEHYDIPEGEDAGTYERIEAALYASGSETGGWSSESLCAYHDNQASKDD